MSQYKLAIKQLVDYPRCRVYHQFIQALICNTNISTGHRAGLYHYAVLCCYANFRTSYKRIGGITYTVRPGQWLCTLRQLSQEFRVRSSRQTISILQQLQAQHLISYSLLGHGKLIRYSVNGWHKSNRVLDYNAPCQKDTGFFFLPIETANELTGSGKCSEMDALLDLWVNTVYRDDTVQGSQEGPVVYFRNGSGRSLVSYAGLAQRWGVSKATAGRYLHKLCDLGYLEMLTFPGSHGSAIYLRSFLSTMFEISDVLVDKEEVAMALCIQLDIPEEVEVPAPPPKPRKRPLLTDKESLFTKQE